MTDWKMTDKEADVACCRRDISWCCGCRRWTAVPLLLLLVDVDAVVVVVVADLLSEKPGAVYPEVVAYGAQKHNSTLEYGPAS